MPTPAEIIAARANGVEPATLLEPSRPTTPKLLSDADAFPVLGGGLRPASQLPKWGPKAPSVVKHQYRSTTVQEAFSLLAEDQLVVARPDFVKILQHIKADTNTSIECTLSQHTRKRTFLISGRPEDVKVAKRLVIKKLTKPVQVLFAVPAKLRSKVIGAQGRTLKPIVAANEVKVDIGSEPQVDPDTDADDVYHECVTVTIDGDAEGCKRAKAQILAIVKEETRTLLVRVPLDDLVRPFAAGACAAVVEKYPLLAFAFPALGQEGTALISGDREAVLEARDEVRGVVAAAAARLAVELVPIPKVKQQFLPIDDIWASHNVLIRLPKELGPVQFIGERRKLAQAQESARNITLQYKVEVMDMSKAHLGNLPHVRAVAHLLTKNGTFAKIAAECGVAVHPPLQAYLADPQNTTIPIEIVVKDDNAEGTKSARRLIVAAVNRVGPEQLLVVDDIDAYFVPRAAKLLDAAGAEYAVLGSLVVLFAEADELDFDSSAAGSLQAASAALEPLRELTRGLAEQVLQISSEDQQVVAGPKGVSLRALVGLRDVKVQLHHNGSGASADEVHLKGAKADVAAVAADMGAVLQEHAEHKAAGGYKTLVEIATAVVPHIIGKSGATLNQLREEHAVRIDVADDDKLGKTEVRIEGLKRHADAAKAALVQMAKRLADETTVRMRIDSEYHRRMAGSGFVYIKRLEDKYNVKIRFPSGKESTHADAPRHKDEVTIRGPLRGVARAEEELHELHKFEVENGHKRTLQIPVKAIPYVIGKNGDNINDVAASCGVDFKFSRNREEEEKQGCAELELVGSKAGIKEAAEKIQETVKEIESRVLRTVRVPRQYHRELVGSGGTYMRELIAKAGGADLPKHRYSRLLVVPKEGSDLDEVLCEGSDKIVSRIVALLEEFVAERDAMVTDTYDVAKDKHRLVVGPSGSVRQLLQDEFGVNISVPQSLSASTDITLKGRPEKIEALKKKLDELTKDRWSAVVNVPVRHHLFVSNQGTFAKLLAAKHKVEVQHGNMARTATSLGKARNPAPPLAAEGDEEIKFTTADFVPQELEEVIPWQLVGEAEAAAEAAKAIEERLEAAKAATKAAWFYSPQASLHFPRIIGAQGTKIAAIRTASGAYISVPRKKEDKYVYLIGSDEALATARAAIEKAIN